MEPFRREIVRKAITNQELPNMYHIIDLILSGLEQGDTLGDTTEAFDIVVSSMAKVGHSDGGFADDFDLIASWIRKNQADLKLPIG